MFRRGFAVTSKSLGTYSLTVFVPSKVPLLLLFAIMANPVSCSSMSVNRPGFPGDSGP